MSRPLHRQTARLRVQSSLFLAGWLIGPATILVALFATAQRDLGLLFAAGVLAVAFGILSLIHLIDGRRTRCAVCSTGLFGQSNCRKHLHARKLAGSYKLLVACDVVTRDRYRCPHCNEHVVCSAKNAVGPRRVKPPEAAIKTLPTIREARHPASQNAVGQRDRISKPDDSPTLSA